MVRFLREAIWAVILVDVQQLGLFLLRGHDFRQGESPVGAT